MSRHLFKWSGEAATGIAVALLAIWVVQGSWTAWERWDFRQTPYTDALDIELTRTGNTITGRFSLTKTKACDFSNSGPAFIRWVDESNQIATGKALIQTSEGWRELQPRTVIPVGDTRQLGPVRMDVPPKFIGVSPLWAQLMVVCDRGDGILRTFEITPRVMVMAGDGPVKPETQ
jgi:hypothetical protein